MKNKWTKTKDQLPPEGVLIDTKYGSKRRLMTMTGNCYYFNGRKVSYTPTEWRNRIFYTASELRKITGCKYYLIQYLRDQDKLPLSNYKHGNGIPNKYKT